MMRVPMPALFIGGAAIGVAVTGLTVALDDDPKHVRAEIDAEVLVDATVIEMHGYDKNGNPGKFLYDCEHVESKLVCTQRDEEAK